ncbi:hypothetical protein [Streptomyces olivaceus]|nr:hypothetical protein [Streptomyces olivaceus]
MSAEQEARKALEELARQRMEAAKAAAAAAEAARIAANRPK